MYVCEYKKPAAASTSAERQPLHSGVQNCPVAARCAAAATGFYIAAAVAGDTFVPPPQMPASLASKCRVMSLPCIYNDKTVWTDTLRKYDDAAQTFSE